MAHAITKLSPETLILDGEVAVFDEQLVSRFYLLNATESDVVVTPPIFMAFDCLYQYGRDLALSRSASAGGGAVQRDDGAGGSGRRPPYETGRGAQRTPRF